MNPNRALTVDPASPLPLWSQIEQGVGRLVASGALAPSRPVPSVRDLARELRVNPATVAKAYQRLVEAGVLEVRRGEGTFVSARPPALPRGERGRQLRDAAGRFAVSAHALGADHDEALTAVKDELRRLGADGGKR